MAKRPRKNVKELEKRAKARTELDTQLNGSSWSTLTDREAEPEHYDYESKPRSFKEYDDNTVERLPVKTADGKIKRVVERAKKVVELEEVEHEHSETESVDDAEEIKKAEEELAEQERLSPQEQLIQLQEQIASLAERLDEDPEENISSLRDLRELMHKVKAPKLKHVATLALVKVFKSLIPGYRIRPLTEIEKKEKVSNDVKKLRNFEESLLYNYKEYIDMLQLLGKTSSSKNPDKSRSPPSALSNTAVIASCELLDAVPHFNFRNDLILIVINRLSRPQKRAADGSKKIDHTFNRCIDTVEGIFKADEEGQVSFDVVRLLVKMIKARRYKVDEKVLNTLLNLRLLTELDVKASQNGISSKPESLQPKISKKDRVHLTKRQRKLRKENKKIDEELQRAETAVSSEERQRLQGETLKLVFILYFNILKQRSSLIAATLEGLAKFAHLINADFFGDLLEVLRELAVERQISTVDGTSEFVSSSTREALLCIVTAFALLSGQAGESMNLDLSFFINHFYSCLYSVALNPEIEFNHKTLRLSDPGSSEDLDNSRVALSTEMELVVKSFESIFFRQRTVSKLRVQAFAKRLAICSLQFPEKSALASLRILDKMAGKFSAISSLFSTDDRVANGVYRMDVDQPDQSNPEAATLWETILLEKHYSPKVAAAAKALPKE